MTTLFEQYGYTAHPKTLENARRAYKIAALVLHPDKRGGSEELMKQLNDEMQGWERHFAARMRSAFVLRGGGGLEATIQRFGAALAERRAYWPAFVRAFYDVQAWDAGHFRSDLARLALWRYDICLFLSRPEHSAHWGRFDTMPIELLPTESMALTVRGAIFATPFYVPHEKLAWVAEQVPCPPEPAAPSDWRYFDELVAHRVGLPDKDTELETLRERAKLHADEVARLQRRIDELLERSGDVPEAASPDERPPKHQRLDETLAMSSDELLGYLTTCCEILIHCAIHPDGGGFGIYDFVHLALKLDIPDREEHRRVYRAVTKRVSKAYTEKRYRGFFMEAVPGDQTIYVSFDATRTMDIYIKELVRWKVMARSIWQSAFFSTPSMIEAANERLKSIARSEEELHFMRRIMGLRDISALAVERHLLQLRLFAVQRTACGFMMTKYRCVNKVVRGTMRCGRHMDL